VAAALALGGCQDQDGSEVVTIGPPATSLATSDPSDGALPDGWTAVPANGLEITLPVPPDWSSLSLVELRSQLAAESDRLAGTQLGRAFGALAADIEAGRIRAVIGGRLSGAQATVFVSVESGDRTLATAVRRRVAEFEEFVEPISATQEEVTLPLGPAVKLTFTSRPSGGTPSLTVEYVLRVGGSTLVVTGAAPDGDQDLEPLMAELTAHLSRP
jgi:hypothetical protein